MLQHFPAILATAVFLASLMAGGDLLAAPKRRGRPGGRSRGGPRPGGVKKGGPAGPRAASATPPPSGAADGRPEGGVPAGAGDGGPEGGGPSGAPRRARPGSGGPGHGGTGGSGGNGAVRGGDPEDGAGRLDFTAALPEPPPWCYPDEGGLLDELRLLPEREGIFKTDPEKSAVCMDRLRAAELAVRGPGDPRAWSASARAALFLSRTLETRQARSRLPVIPPATLRRTARGAAALAAGAAEGLARAAAGPSGGPGGRGAPETEKRFAGELLAACRLRLGPAGHEALPPAYGLMRATLSAQRAPAVPAPPLAGRPPGRARRPRSRLAGGAGRPLAPGRGAGGQGRLARRPRARGERRGRGRVPGTRDRRDGRTGRRVGSAAALLLRGAGRSPGPGAPGLTRRPRAPRPLPRGRLGAGDPCLPPPPRAPPGG
jgi:hypothetical protein